MNVNVDKLTRVGIPFSLPETTKTLCTVSRRTGITSFVAYYRIKVCIRKLNIVKGRIFNSAVLISLLIAGRTTSSG